MSMRPDRRSMRARLMAASLALAVTTMVTPCCDLYAAINPSTGHADARQAPDAHERVPDAFCASALDEIASPLVELAAPPSPAGVVSWPAPPASDGLWASSAAPTTSVRPGGSGPPLYLRFAHLLL
jgi:hypothetical protein